MKLDCHGFLPLRVQSVAALLGLGQAVRLGRQPTAICCSDNWFDAN